MASTFVPLAEGVGLLQDHTSEIIWHGQSLFLCAGCDDVLPAFHISLSSEVRWEPDRLNRFSQKRRVALTFETNDNTLRWAKASGAQLLLPPRQVVACVGDKTQLLDILECAHIHSIPTRLYEAKSYPDTQEIWRDFDNRLLVVQLPENNLTGKGTRLISDRRELSETFAEWGEERLKVSQYLEGLQLTISGCVGPSQTIVSAISKQFVGLPRLTCYWGAHCGNQLVNSSDLEEGVAGRCRDICVRVGDELRRRGFLGVFGLDLVQTRKNEVFVIEINPRLQSVSSLINIAEIEANMLPLPGVHLLCFLLDRMPVVALKEASTPPPLSQVVLYARRSGLITSVPANGCYRLENGTLVLISGDMNLRGISNDDGLIWNFATAGEYAKEETRLCVLQTRFYLTEATPETILTDKAREWVDCLESLFEFQS